MSKMFLTFLVLYGIMINIDSFPCNTATALEKKSVCGLTWGDATSKCAICCTYSTECPVNEHCWAGANACFTNTQSSSTTTTTAAITTTTTTATTTTTSDISTTETIKQFDTDTTTIGKTKKFNPIILLYILGSILVIGACIFVLYLFRGGQKKQEEHVKTFNMTISKKDKNNHEIIDLQLINNSSSEVDKPKILSIGKLTPTVSANSLRGSEDLKDIFDKYINNEVNKISQDSTIVEVKYNADDSPSSQPSNPDVSQQLNNKVNDSNINVLPVNNKASVNGINMNEGNPNA